MPNTLQNMKMQYRAGHDIAKQNIALQNKKLQNNIFEFENHQSPIHAYRMSKIQNSTRKYTTAYDTIAQDRTKHKKEKINMAKKEEIISLNKINVKHAKVIIIGDGTLCLNKMNDVAARNLTDERKNKSKSLEKSNMWEEIITSIHWRDGKPEDYSEEGLHKALEENAPCITAFGLKKSFGDAVVRNGIDKYQTKFAASVNVVGKNGLVPIKFSQYSIDEKLMSPKKGSPVLVHLNRFSGWSAEIEIDYIENTYSLEQIINIINLAGFGIGIGSGRSSGYGRYHVAGVD